MLRARSLLLAVATLLVVAACAATPKHLRYTSKMEMQPSTATGPSDPILESIGRSVSQMVLPGGAVTMTTTVGEYGIRLEWDRELPGIPAGATMIYNAKDGTSVVVNRPAKTYWRIPPSAVSDLFPAQTRPQVTTAKTGQEETIAGVRAEKMTFEIRMPLPGPPDQPRPAGMPGEVTMTGEAWVAPQFAKYLGPAAKFPAMNSLGMDVLAQHGLQMKQVLRSPLFGAQQLETTVTSVSEIFVAPEQFTIPAGFTETMPVGAAGSR
jgi:hypothetical protein